MERLLFLRDCARKVCGMAAGFLMAAISVIALWQVFARYVLNSPSTYSEELLRYAMIWMGFLGAAYGFGDGTHLSLSVLEERLSKTGRLILKLFQSLVVNASLVAVMIYGGYKFTEAGVSQASSTLGISMGYVYAILPLSGVFMVAFGLMSILTVVTEHKREAI